MLNAKVTEKFFSNDDDREVFKWIRSHWSNYGKVPGVQALRSNFPTYDMKKGKEPLQYYLDEVRERREFGIMFEFVAEATEKLEEYDTEAAKNTLSAGLTKVFTEVSALRDTNIVDNWKERLATYEEWEKFGHLLKGIPSGFPTLDEGLRGFQEEQLITFVGAPKSGKSWMMLIMSIAAQSVGADPLFIGFEMSNEEQEARYDAIVSEISYDRLLKGRMTAEEKKRLHRELKKRRTADPLIMSSDPEGTTVSAITAKIEQHNPGIVFIDGVYMMDDENGEPKGSPQALTNITRSLKRLARTRKIPIVISTQVLLWKLNKKKGIDEGAIGYTSSFIQDSDVVLGVENSDPENPDDPIKRIKVVLGRTVPKFSVQVYFDWEHTTFQELKFDFGDDVGFGTKAEKEDVEEDTWEPGTKVVRRKPVPV